MRVLQLIDTLSVGGAQRLQLTYTQAAIARGLQPTILSLRDPSNSPVAGQLQAAGARVIVMPGKGLKDLARINRLRRFLRADGTDLIHAHLGYAIILGAVAGRLARVPMVASLHSTKPDAKQWLETLALRHGTKHVIAVGSAVAEAYQGRLRSRTILVLPNPVTEGPILSETRRLALRAELAGEAGRRLIVSAGRLAPDKGYVDLLDAIDQVRRTHPDVLLVIAGTGRLKDQLEARIGECDLHGHVRLLGLRDDVREILAAADLYVSASLREGLPITILEAMAAGLPVVATSVGEVPELLRDQRGRLVAPGQPEELHRAIVAALDEPALGIRMGFAAREYVRRRHSPDGWYERLVAIYEEAAPR